MTARAVAVQMGRNRPSLGAVAFLLAVPGAAHAVLGWPIWTVAAPLWGLYVALMLFVSIAELRQSSAVAPPADSPAAKPRKEDHQP
ncbi:hypothetical protein ACFQU9_44315 [Actinomadura namibiensis]|uniref:Uncharacterized protein n=1 Tax=Actinomadura namibiensis TaxID=182080 RepID=A0A7W3LTH1_ACTNM|nr:hypothetical protein [Actinomadura namibiensis]MBA8953947.1 hypothetical protein [Actinomadura namibiensis]